jgi:isoleucyl-tRNA synthetase
LRYQNGFDCQGLWVEVEVEKELKLGSKRDIENLVPGDPFASIDRFVQLCKDRVNKFARIQTEQSIRLGYWMDWDRDEDWQKPPDERRSYFTMSDENNYTIWSFLKKCHSRDLVYKAYDAMPWCPRCAVGLSEMEMKDDYQLVADRSVFVRFPLKDRPGENLLVWTTTPWTLTSNVAAAVNPDLTYLKVRHKDQLYYVAKGAFTAHRREEEFKRKEWVDGVPKLKTLEQIFKEKGGSEIEGEISGREMLGWTYDGPFDELTAQQEPFGFPDEIATVVRRQGWGPDQPARNLHRVIAWKDVGEGEGTGIVHIAPGCGREDFQLGREQQLAFVAPLDENGNFLPGFGPLEGKYAVAPATTQWIIDNLKEKGAFLAEEKYPHSYPHCWRCKTAVLFRLVDEWFIGMSWREEIMKICHDIRWIPDFGLQRELDWLKNMGDWMISKKRFWGLALPIWVCDECDWFDVIGGRDELRQRAVSGWTEFAGHSPHRPWIDLVKVRCDKCGAQASRIPDVGNPWLDAGIVPLSTMKYNTDREYWAKWFPADFITESFPGQFRNWFYSLLAMSTMMVDRAPFRVLLGHGLVRDQWGRPMSKSGGNSIQFEDAADCGYTIKNPKGIQESHPPMGADVVRWLYSRQNPAPNLNFGPEPANEVHSTLIMKFWNTYAFLCNYAGLDGFDPAAPQVPVKDRRDIDRWILSELQKLIQKAHKEFSDFNVHVFCLEAEDFVDDRLSNWYVRRNRPRFWKSEQGADKLAAYQTLYTVVFTLAKLFAPIIPFLTEAMYQNLKSTADAESVHHCAYPAADASLIDEDLSADMESLLRLVSLGSAARNLVKIKVRQPLNELRIQPGNEHDRRAVERFDDQIREELNLKRVTLHESNNGSLLSYEIKPNPKTLGPKFGPRLKDVTAALTNANTSAIVEKVSAGQPYELNLASETVTLEPTDVFVQARAGEGWTGLADRKTQLALDARITPELHLEGLAREVVRHVQQLRKDADLALEDRIALCLETDSTLLRQAIEVHRDYIAKETLTKQWATAPLQGTVFRKEAQVEGNRLRIELKRVEAVA